MDVLDDKIYIIFIPDVSSSLVNIMIISGQSR